MALSSLEIVLNYLKSALPVVCGMILFTWLFFTCFKIDSDNKLKGNYFIWKNLNYIKDDPELKARIIEHMEKMEEVQNEPKA
ncbi:MAG: hypothetical protein PHS93_08100 [Candidatus Omnitrophica bacterium]|nr:hypothetical protein [Candidatus Omnitrophota bacterium]MDD5353104.1 hypothetical protein [Candidatus Omnitrophota bacterium]MDD5551481.1 hypothetical protein [Candidatus Omnitrophota bacterium]